MKWDFQRSKDRLASERARIQDAGLNIQRLSREMNLSNLSPTDARIVHGCHIYCHINNFADVLDSPLMRKEDFKRLHRLLHILRIEQRLTLQQVFDGDKIQVQGPKFHGLLYKPYDDDPGLAWKSVLAGIALNLILRNALPEVFPDYPTLMPSTGISLGDCLVANIGPRGERELISVGAAANHAAKILENNNALTISYSLWSKLSEEHQDLFFPDNNAYVLDEAAIEDQENLLADEGYTWTAKKSSERMTTTGDDLPLSDIGSSEAQVLINFDLLGPKTMKTCSGVSLFVDIDKYTATIDQLFGDETKLGQALQWLHLFRYEMRNVAADQSTVAVQHQGDRLQVLSHLPCDDGTAAMQQAVDLCIDLNSSMEEVLNEFHADLGKLHVAIGASFGKTVALRSGVRGDMDAGCLSKEISQAEHWQIKSAGGEISISPEMYEAIDDEITRDQFALSSDKTHYVGRNLTWTKIADLRKSRKYESQEAVGFNSKSSGIVFGISASQAPDVTPLKQTRPWGLSMRADAPFRAGNARGTIWTPARVKHEFEILSHVHFFRILTHGLTNGVLQIVGVLSFTQEETGRIYSLKVRLEYPRDYFWAVPSIFDQDKQFRPSADGHQFPDHRLCLSFPEREEFGIGSEQLSSEVLGASLIWLDKRYIFERNGKWPGEAEEHGWTRPLRRLLKEEARRSRNGYLSAWTDWIIAELATPQFHMRCPCCSGKRFLDCHWRLAMLSAQYLFSMQYERGLDEHRSALEAA